MKVHFICHIYTTVLLTSLISHITSETIVDLTQNINSNNVNKTVSETVIITTTATTTTPTNVDNDKIKDSNRFDDDSINIKHHQKEPPPPFPGPTKKKQPTDTEIPDFVLLETISTNSGIKGTPDITSAASIISLAKNTAEEKLEKVFKDGLIIDSNGTLDSALANNAADILHDGDGDLTLTNHTKDENVLNEEIPVPKDIEFPQNVPPDGQINPINDSGGVVVNLTVSTPTPPPVDVDANNVLNATVDENQIPVFSEWAQKRMEEAEKRMEQDNVNTSVYKKNTTAGHHKATTLKLRVKNYASPDCGAKIIAANAEASSIGSVLSTTKDEYLLSPCTSRIWFVVELCEAIQAEIIDLANFELFSSSPKNFSVSVSNRFPTREWSNVGKFTAKDERNVQTFDLYPHLFGKYVRVDIYSHYNSEHFCPISLFRVYGTSEFEAFETENRVHVEEDDDDDIDDDQLVDVEIQKLPKKTNDNNIFKSASDAVMSIVKKAASFVQPSENKTNGGCGDSLTTGTAINNNSTTNCITPAFKIQCRNCAENVTEQVQETFSCKQMVLNQFLNVDFIKNSLRKTSICANLIGLNVTGDCNDTFDSVLTDLRKTYALSFFPISYVAAMCNILAQMDHRHYLPHSRNSVNLSESDLKKSISPTSNNDKINVNNSTQFGDHNQSSKNVQNDRIETVNVDERNMLNDQPLTDGIFEGSGKSVDDIADSLKIAPSNDNTQMNAESTTVNDTIDDDKPKIPNQFEMGKENGTLDESLIINNTWDSIDDAFLTETATATIANNLSDVAALGDGDQIGANTGNQQIGQQKVHSESIFLRLSNRIKALERNMTLSSQYLEELSRRYKKQVEELQQSFAKTLQIVEEQNKKNSEREIGLHKQIQILQQDIEQLTDRIFSWTNICFYICCFAFIQISVVWMILKIFSQREHFVYDENSSVGGIDSRRMRINCRSGFSRRNSFDGKCSSISLKKRRPSEEALNISGTYKELLILEDSDGNKSSIEEYDSFGETSKRKSKQKNRKSANRRTASAVEIELRKKMFSRPESTPGEYEMLKDISSSNSCSDEHPPLDENYDIYLPGSDPYEFIPDEPSSGVDNLTPMINGDSAGTTSNTDKSQTKIRRLSSPAFLKSPFSRSQRKKQHETTTGWEWHRLKRDPNHKQDASQIKNSKKSKSESPEVKVNGSISSNNSKDSKDSLKTSASFNSSDKKQGSFRRMWKKVF